MSEKDLTIQTPWEELERRFADILNSNKTEDEESNTSCFESSFRVDKRPILPPLMTSDKRQQCKEWREQAMSVQQRLQDQQHVVEESSESESEVVYVRSQSTSSLLSGGRLTVAEFHDELDEEEESGGRDQMAISGAFKALIHKLRGELMSSKVERRRRRLAETALPRKHAKHQHRRRESKLFSRGCRRPS